MAIEIRALQERELPEADRIFRLAFGTFVKLPDPLMFGGDSDFVRTRWRADPPSALAAVRDGELLGSNFVCRWGSFGFFGPLSIRPELWNAGVAKQLLVATMERFESWRCPHTGLFTFAESPKHIGLYQRYGFYPRFLTPIMAKDVTTGAPMRTADQFSDLSSADRAGCLKDCAALTGSLLDGLDVGSEIRAVHEQALGDTLLLGGAGGLRGLAVCHVGPGTEAGSGVCYVKFAAVRPGPQAAAEFEQLLDLCERFAAARGVGELVAGVNAAREGAYRTMLARGFRTFIQGVAMQRPNEAGYNRPEVFAIDDWR